MCLIAFAIAHMWRNACNRIVPLNRVIQEDSNHQGLRTEATTPMDVTLRLHMQDSHQRGHMEHRVREGCTLLAPEGLQLGLTGAMEASLREDTTDTRPLQVTTAWGAAEEAAAPWR